VYIRRKHIEICAGTQASRLNTDTAIDGSICFRGRRLDTLLRASVLGKSLSLVSLPGDREAHNRLADLRGPYATLKAISFGREMRDKSANTEGGIALVERLRPLTF
jgi:hypothetical protein